MVVVEAVRGVGLCKHTRTHKQCLNQPRPTEQMCKWFFRKKTAKEQVGKNGFRSEVVVVVSSLVVGWDMVQVVEIATIGTGQPTRTAEQEWSWQRPAAWREN